MGVFLKFLATGIYSLLFVSSAIVLGIYSYFLSRLSVNHLPISNRKRAIEGISGSAVLYTIFAMLLTCILGGRSIFAFAGLMLDLLFAGGFIAIAIMTRRGSKKCSGFVYTPLGDGPTNANDSGYATNNFGFSGNVSPSYTPRLGTACRLNKAVFAVSIIAAAFFIIAALAQASLHRRHRRDAKFGPSPANNYTSGPGRKRFWKRGGTATAAGAGASVPFWRSRRSGGATAAGAPVVVEKHDPHYHTGPSGTAVTGNHY